jgi:hypothetical protein
MMTDKELMKLIDKVSTEYHGQFDDLQEIVGMVMVGRLYGWRVTRLVSSRRLWTLACNKFGDLKEILPRETDLSKKSVGLNIIDAAGDYWEFINGKAAAIPIHERKQIA